MCVEKLKYTVFICYVLIAVQCRVTPNADALQFNLTESCDNTQIFFCTLTNITVRLNDPLIVANATAPQLYELVVRDSLLARFPSALLAQAPALRSLLMHNCGLNRLTAYDYPKGHPLKSLILQKNRFSDVPEKAFITIYELEELQLGRNTIHMVHQNAFDGLDKLRYLDLQQNDIRELPKSVFDDLINLEHIDLSSNNIELIVKRTFAQNTKLQTLLLGDNKFTEFAANALEHLPHLHLLDISNSNVDELSLQSVDTLLLSGSTLSSVVIAGSAVKVHAGNNQLTSLNIGDKLSVRELDLHGNRLESLEDLVGMLNLQRLDVSRNQLQSLRTSHSPLYLPLHNLVHLNLASNQLQNLSAETFVLLQKLTHLDLAFNHLLRLDQRLFEPLVNLEKFYIEGNGLHFFDYEQFVAAHAYLKEFGMFENYWEYRYMRTMSAFLQDKNIQLPVRFTSNSYSNNNGANVLDATLNLADKVAAHHRYAFTGSSSSMDDFDQLHAEGATVDADLTGIHPYWTTRDVLTMVILLLVFLILLLQLITFCREEECLPNCCNRIARNAHANQRQRLDEEEEDSEV
ncbi:insulin-like growth factor-binding protein complex acid labile subunit [Eurosta solidaginis]|uniref:insulin-like growth factor-binding protein complex acid labile subunit n=1 Tax=Eurosta solidaginis TaxID=178769 RepID=UPI003530B681